MKMELHVRHRLAEVVIVLMLGSFQGAWAIGILPIQMTHPDELVKRTHNITLSRIVSAEYRKGTVFYSFEVIECIKGALRKEARGVIAGVSSGNRAALTYDDHQKKGTSKIAIGCRLDAIGCRTGPLSGDPGGLLSVMRIVFGPEAHPRKRRRTPGQSHLMLDVLSSMSPRLIR